MLLRVQGCEPLELSGTLWALKATALSQLLIRGLTGPSAAALLQLGPREAANLAQEVASQPVNSTASFTCNGCHTSAGFGVGGAEPSQSLQPFAEAQYFSTLALNFLVGQVATAEAFGPVEAANIMWAAAALRHLDMASTETMSRACAQAVGEPAAQKPARMASKLVAKLSMPNVWLPTTVLPKRCGFHMSSANINIVDKLTSHPVWFVFQPVQFSSMSWLAFLPIGL